ncbi:Ku protein [Saccharopolyspora shandongensis]|uniref:Ku protein n=1 Tax=Saccharopolyspora shandongensis TaxID=418495 RepID=UPI0033D36449
MALLREALETTNRAGIATFVMRYRQYLAALKTENHVLALHVLHWADEIRDPQRELHGGAADRGDGHRLATPGLQRHLPGTGAGLVRCEAGPRDG